MKTWQILGLSIVLAAVAAGAALFLYHPQPASNGDGVQPPPVQQVDVASLRARAEQGSVPAQVQLGRLYANGESVQRSYSEAVGWYQKAAAQSNAEAQLALGELYEAGQGVPKDLTQAVKLYRQAAEQGLAAAQYTVGFLYEAGKGVNTDQAEATRWFRRAAEQGDPLAQFDLGQRYDLGVGVETNTIEAYRWLALAAAQGQPDSAPRLKKVQAKMSRSDIDEAKRRVAEFSARKAAPQ